MQRCITVFGQALARFDEALARPEDPIVRDACMCRLLERLTERSR